MGTVTDIAQALVDAVIAGVADVDYGSASEFLPAVQTSKVAVLAVPFAQSTTFDLETLDAGELVATHRIRLEFWTKHTQGAASVTMQRARDVATSAMAVLIANDGDDYELAAQPAEETVDPAMVQYSQASWLVSVLMVPVRNIITV